METPILPAVLKNYYDSVYEPAEDSFLMLDALENEIDQLRNINPTICLEIGCGTGIVITGLARHFGSAISYFCTDINEDATKATTITSAANQVSVQPVVMDLTTAFEHRLQGCVDILLFNPPYVVTPNDEVGGRNLSASWAGGENGRKVIDRIFPVVDRLLSINGRFYLLTLKANDIYDIFGKMSTLGFQARIVLQRRCGAEKLYVSCFVRTRL